MPDVPKSERKRSRKPNVTTLLKQAQRAGLSLVGATVTITADSASLTLGQPQAPGTASNINEWDAEYGGETPKAH